MAPSADDVAAVETAVRLSGAGVGPDKVHRLVARWLRDGSQPEPSAVLRELARRERTALDRTHEAAERAGARLAASAARVLVAGLPAYPARLATLWPELGAPLWLFVRAAAELPEGPAVAVVGTRQPTADGLATATELARLLAEHGVVVVSGMARGIDQAAHRGALDAGGVTVGVIGTGFGVDYPRGIAPLAERVARSGGLVSELPPGAPPRAHQFLARNRILSGLADAVVVVEGRSRSGALATARLAAEQGRDVWAVPGSLHQPTSTAPLELIRDGARPLTRLDDVLEVLGAPGAAAPASGRAARDGDPDGGAATVPAPRRRVAADGPPVPDGPASAVATALSAVPASAGALASATGLGLPAVLSALAELQARGLARTTPRGWIAAPPSG